EKIKRQKEREKKKAEAAKNRKSEGPKPQKAEKPAPKPAAPPPPMPSDDDLIDEAVREHPRPKPPAELRPEPTLHVQGPVEEEEGDLAERHHQPDAATFPYAFPPIDLLDEPDPGTGVDLD